MTTETDLPCTDCGTDLRERTLPTNELLLPVEAQQDVTIAECPNCGGRYYPDDTVTVLAEAIGAQRTEGSS